jgi:choline dehydrogenase-like flavoprotein
MMIVVGSGPCGVACAYQLLKSGKQVVMLDAGMEVVPDYRRELLRFIANEAFETLFTHRKRETCYAEWAVNGLVDSDIGHYDSICRFHSYDIHHGKVLLSLARGGFSNVWGGAVLPIRREDVAGWPIRYEELQKHFSTVDEMMGMSCSEEWPVSQFDIGLRSAIYPDLTNQSQEILDNLERCKDRLSRCGIYFSKARIALGPNHSPFRSTTVLDKLLKNPNFRYIPKIFVLEVKEENHSVNIFGYDLINGKLDLVRCDRLFLACGALASTAIIARSLCMFDHTFYFKDTQHFVLPVMQLQRPRITIAEKENELAQIFVEISDQCIGNRFVHLQVYGYSDQLHQLTQQWFKWVPNQIISSIGDVVFERVIMILGFLPSDISGKLEVHK